MPPTTPYNPSWKKHEEDLTNPDNKKSLEAADKFDLERQYEMANDPKAKRWEESRKKAWAKDKPEWAKAKRKEKEERVVDLLRELKNGGTYMKNLKPVPGYIIVKKVKMDSITESGIALPDDAQLRELPTADVVDISGDKQHDNGVVEKCPCKVGDKILHRFGAGLDISSKQGDIKLMGFADVLAIFED